MEDTHTTTHPPTTAPAPFTTEELLSIADDVADTQRTVAYHHGYRYTFTIDHDEDGADYINSIDCHGSVGWGTIDRNTEYGQRPAGFTGAARKISASRGCDSIWWEPYRDETTVYDTDADYRLVLELLEYGTVYATVTVDEQCGTCDSWHEVAAGALGSIESPAVSYGGGTEYLAEVFADIISELPTATTATTATTTTTTTTTTGTTTGTTTAAPPTWEDYGNIEVCTDCYFAHHYGAHEHDGQWYAGDSDTPCDREPLSNYNDPASSLSDNTCSDHTVEDTYDEDGDATGDTTACEYCGNDGYENGIVEFSWRRCDGCDSHLGGSRHRLWVQRVTG